MNLRRRRQRPQLPADEKAALIKQLVHQPCVHCGGVHETACPRVKTLAFSSDGKTIVGVEFWPWNKWPKDGVLWLSDVYADGDEVPALSEEEQALAQFGGNPLLFMLNQFARHNALAQRRETP